MIQESTTEYLLFSDPLPATNLSNQVYMERGYLGSLIIVMYSLIMTIVTVRFVCVLRVSGVKRQLHMAGMQPLAFWVGNYLFEGLCLLSTFIAVYAAIFLGGAPVKNYFFSVSFSGPELITNHASEGKNVCVFLYVYVGMCVCVWICLCMYMCVRVMCRNSNKLTCPPLLQALLACFSAAAAAACSASFASCCWPLAWSQATSLSWC